MKNRIWTIALRALLVVPLAFAQSTSLKDFKHWSPQEGSWAEDPEAPGTYSKDVIGSAKTGNWIMYVKFNPGAWANWHWHSNPQMMYIVSGTMNYEVRPHQIMKLTPGSYVIVPARALHNGTCISKEPCTFFIENPLPNDRHMTDANGKELNQNRNQR
jgi:quercetin dioxygenase-like cupin family protein